MRSDNIPGGVFPDSALPDRTGTPAGVIYETYLVG